MFYQFEFLGNNKLKWLHLVERKISAGLKVIHVKHSAFLWLLD